MQAVALAETLLPVLGATLTSLVFCLSSYSAMRLWVSGSYSLSTAFLMLWLLVGLGHCGEPKRGEP